MLASRLFVIACITLSATAASADPGDLPINEWATVDNGGQSVTKSRAEVKAELEVAQRLGLVSVGESHVPTATAEQERAIQEAGRRAFEQFAKSTGTEG